VPVRLPRLLNDAEVVVKLRRWAEEFDAQDRRRRYTAQQFIEWIELEHIPAPRPTAEQELSYPVTGVRLERLSIPDRLLQVG